MPEDWALDSGKIDPVPDTPVSAVPATISAMSSTHPAEAVATGDFNNSSSAADQGDTTQGEWYC